MFMTFYSKIDQREEGKNGEGSLSKSDICYVVEYRNKFPQVTEKQLETHFTAEGRYGGQMDWVGMDWEV